MTLDSPSSAGGDIVALWAWRRTIADLYAGVRAGGVCEPTWRRWAETRRDLFRTHPQSPIEAADRGSYQGPYAYRYDPRFRFETALTEIAGAKVGIDVGADGRVILTPFARTDGLAAMLGGELTLFWIGGYGGGVFLPFADATNRRETYGGGRYLLDTIKGADLGSTSYGRVILDFNFSYFPSCAYSDRFICPLSPPENRLPAAVTAGECLAQICPAP